MKRKNILVAALVVLALAVIPACDLIEECGTCEMVTIDANNNETRGTPLPFCGDDLKDRENEPPVTINGVTTYWDCY